MFEHLSGTDARQVGTSRRRRERQAQTDHIVGWIRDDGLIEVPNLDFHMLRRIGDAAEIAEVAVAANPDGRPVWQRAGLQRAEPLIVLDRIASNVRAPFSACGIASARRYGSRASQKRSRFSGLFPSLPGGPAERVTSGSDGAIMRICM